MFTMGHLEILVALLLWICLWFFHWYEPIERSWNVAFTGSFLFLFSRTMFSWLSFSIFYGYFECMTLCVLSINDVGDWFLDTIEIWYPSLENGAGLVISIETWYKMLLKPIPIPMPIFPSFRVNPLFSLPSTTHSTIDNLHLSYPPVPILHIHWIWPPQHTYLFSSSPPRPHHLTHFWVHSLPLPTYMESCVHGHLHLFDMNFTRLWMLLVFYLISIRLWIFK